MCKCCQSHHFHVIEFFISILVQVLNLIGTCRSCKRVEFPGITVLEFPFGGDS